MKNIHILLLISYCFLLGCNDYNNDIEVNLTTSINESIKFDFLYQDFYAKSLIEVYPKFYKNLIENVDLTSDSLIIATFNSSNKNFKYQLFKDGLIDEERFKSFKIDSLLESKKEKQNQLSILFDKKNDGQDIYLKSNESNEYKYYFSFPKNFNSLPDSDNIIEEIPIINFSYDTYIDGVKYTLKRKIKVYPSLDDTNFISSTSNFVKKSRTTISFKDYWKGSFTYKNENYDVAIQGRNSSYSTILIKNDSLAFSKESSAYNKNFTFYVKDTISLKGDLFVIDSLYGDISKLSLKKIDNKFFNGHRIGETIKDYQLKGLDKIESRISNSHNKKFLIVYFWGTWCKYCIKSMPDLIKVREKYKENSNVIGIAFDKDITEVNQFIKDHNLVWQNYFSDIYEREGGIVEGLKISNFPTYLLIDNKMKVIHRGSELEDLENVLEKL